MSAAWNGGDRVNIFRAGSRELVGSIKLPEDFKAYGRPMMAQIIFDVISLVDKTIEVEGLDKFLAYPFVERTEK